MPSMVILLRKVHNSHTAGYTHTQGMHSCVHTCTQTLHAYYIGLLNETLDGRPVYMHANSQGSKQLIHVVI